MQRIWPARNYNRKMLQSRKRRKSNTQSFKSRDHAFDEPTRGTNMSMKQWESPLNQLSRTPQLDVQVSSIMSRPRQEVLTQSARRFLARYIYLKRPRDDPGLPLIQHEGPPPASI